MNQATHLLSTVVLLTLLANAGAMAQDAPDGFPLTVTDRAGRELTLEGPPERVVCYYNDCYGMLATLDFKPVAQAVNPEMLTDPIYFDGTGSTIRTLKSGDNGPDLEDVASVRPDLVFVGSEEEAQALEGVAPALLTPDPATIEELYEAARWFGTVVGRAAAAETAIERFEARFTAYQKRAPGGVSVLKLGVADDDVFYISTVDDPICRILNALARCDWQKASPDEFWGYETNIEGVLALDPDVIILNNWSSATHQELLARVSASSLWNELKAVQGGRVLTTPGYDNTIASSLPAAQKFLDVYMPLLFPEAFPEPLTDEQVQDILADTN